MPILDSNNVIINGTGIELASVDIQERQYGFQDKYYSYVAVLIKNNSSNKKEYVALSTKSYDCDGSVIDTNKAYKYNLAHSETWKYESIIFDKDTDKKRLKRYGLVRMNLNN